MKSKLRTLTSWSNQWVTLPNQSNFHEHIRLIFTTESFFKKLSCYQEVNVKDLIPTYQYHTHRYDWYIKELNLILELHGDQHYKPISFGNVSFREKMNTFQNIQQRDSMKESAALENDLFYLALPYRKYHNVDGDTLKTIIIGHIHNEF